MKKWIEQLTKVKNVIRKCTNEELSTDDRQSMCLMGLKFHIQDGTSSVNSYGDYISKARKYANVELPSSQSIDK